MSTSGCSPRDVPATARPKSIQQVRFAETSVDAEGILSSSPSSDSSSHFQRLRIRNTFIDVDCETPACKRRTRTRTALAFQFCGDEAGRGLPSDVLTSQRDEDTTGAHMRAAVSSEALDGPSRTWRPSTEEMIARFNSQGTYAVRVKNTFIELEDGSAPHRRRPRSKTELNGVLGCDLQSPDERSSDASTEDDGSEAMDEPTEDQVAETPPPPFCGTPTPRWEALADQGLIFCQPQTLQLPQAPLQMPLPAIWLAAPPSSALPAAGAAEGPKRQEGRAEAAEGASRARRARPRTSAQQQGPPARLRPCSLQQQALRSSEVDGFVRVQWTVDERKLRGSDKRLVSPSFEVDFGLGSSPASFVVMLYPRSATFRGSASFQKAGGVGQVHLKCVSELGDDKPATIRISIGGGQDRLMRGPFAHSFAASPLFTLPREQAEWDFGAAVEDGSAVVSVDVALA